MILLQKSRGERQAWLLIRLLRLLVPKDQRSFLTKWRVSWRELKPSKWQKQARINVLEKETSSFRDEIDELLLASESLQRQLNELKGQHDLLERRHKEKIEILEDEKAVLRSRSSAKEEELH